MDFIHSLALGLIQGLTEFIPVSSTGHLIIARTFMGLPQESGLAFDAIIQLASALAVLVFFWPDIWKLLKTFSAMLGEKECDKESENMIWAIIAGTIPAVILGLLLESKMETVFRSPYFVVVGLLVGSVLFYFAEKKGKQTNDKPTPKLGLFAGFFQSLALFPGMSRSGSTISGGLLLGLTRESAVRLSFLLSLPIILGSGLKKLYDVWQTGALQSMENSLIVGSVAAFVSGLVAISFLINFLKKNSLIPFAIYRVVLALLLLVFLLVK